MFITRSIYTSLVLGCLFPRISIAQPDEELEEIIVVANRVPIPLRQIATSVSVLNKEAIQDHGNIGLHTVLRQTAGIGASSNGGIGTTSALRIRGEEGYRTLVMVDGLRLSDPSAPQVATPIEHVLSHSVDRVEILRGPQGLSYGADAGGVVALTTAATSSGLNGGLDAQTGSFGSTQKAANLSYAEDNYDFAISGSDFSSDGFNSRLSDSVVADDDGYENSSYHARLGARLSDSMNLQLVHRDVSGESQYDGCFASTTVYDCEALYDFRASRLALQYETEAFGHSLAYNHTQTDREDFALGNFAFGSQGEISRWEYVGNASKLPGFDLIFGIDLENEKNGSLERDNEGYYLELLSDFSSQFFFTAGVRQDDNDDFGSHTSYRLSAAYLTEFATGRLKLKASYGSGFRAPSLFEVDYNLGPFSFPPASNVVLDPETSSGFEFGFEYSYGQRGRVEVVAFDQEVKDAIFFDLSGFSGYLQDTGVSHSEGVEANGEWQFTDTIGIVANYTYNDTARPDGRQRLRRPEHLANAGLRYRSLSQRVQFNAFYRLSREAIDDVFGNQVPLADFEVLDLSASFRISDELTLYARIENALDEEYQEVSDFRAPERASYLGLRVNF